MKALSELNRRVSRAVDLGRGIRLAASDLDTLAASGLLEALASAASAEQKALAETRIADARRAGNA